MSTESKKGNGWAWMKSALTSAVVKQLVIVLGAFGTGYLTFASHKGDQSLRLEELRIEAEGQEFQRLDQLVNIMSQQYSSQVDRYSELRAECSESIHRVQMQRDSLQSIVWDLKMSGE